MQVKYFVVLLLIALSSACSFTPPEKRVVVSSAPNELRATTRINSGTDLTGQRPEVLTAPRPLPEPFILIPTEPATSPGTWSNITDARAVSDVDQPRLVVECYNGRVVVRHDDMSLIQRDVSRTLFRVGSRAVVGIGDRYNNYYIDHNSSDNLVEQMYVAPAGTVVTATTDEEVTTQVGLNGYRQAVSKVFGVCNY